MDYEEIGQRVRKYRKECGLSQEQLAERVGISVTHMSHIETGSTKLSLAVFVDLADSLSVKTDNLLHGPVQPDEPHLREEIINLLRDCSEQELSVLLDVLKATKKSLDEHI